MSQSLRVPFSAAKTAAPGRAKMLHLKLLPAKMKQESGVQT